MAITTSSPTGTISHEGGSIARVTQLGTKDLILAQDGAEFAVINKADLTTDLGLNNNMDNWNFIGYPTPKDMDLTINAAKVKIDFKNHVLCFSVKHKYHCRLFPSGGPYETPEVGILQAAYVRESELLAVGQGLYPAANIIHVASYWANALPDDAIVLLAKSTNNELSGALVDDIYHGSIIAKNKEATEKNTTDIAKNTTDIANIKPAPYYKDIHLKFKNFVSKYRKREQDVTVVILGDSIFAREYHTTNYDVATQRRRPPTLVGGHTASLLYDKLAQNWKQDYWRHDSGAFTETGAFSTIGYPSNNSATTVDWDDADATGNYWDRPAETRYFDGTGEASVQFTMTAGLWRTNWIYRTTSNGSSLTVAIAEGDGKLQVYDGAAWVEANGYVLNTLEARAGAGYGNTSYQERLKFRAKGTGVNSLAEAKTITISKAATGAAEQLAYWGIETSKDEFMLIYINSSRGAHSLTRLKDYIKMDVFERNPDLVIFQIPASNMGTFIPSTNPSIGAAELQEFLWDAAYDLGLGKDSATYTNYDVIVLMPLWNYSAVENNDWKQGNSVDGRVRTCFDGVNAMMDVVEGGSVELAALNMFETLILDIPADKNPDTVIQGSGVTGDTYTDDNTHPNDNGTKVSLKYFLPLFDFI